MKENDVTATNLYSLFEHFGSIIKIEKDRPVFSEGERSEEVYFIQSGSVRISKDTESGRILTLRISGALTFIGEASVFCETIYHSVSATAIEPTQVLALSRSQLEKLLTTSPVNMMEWMKLIQAHNLKNETRFRDLLLHGKKGALFSTLVRLSNTYGVQQENGSILINYSLTNQELANFCATSREVVNRMLNDLKNNQIISFQKGIITIHDFAFLRKEIECDNCPIDICRVD
ncbi:CRP/FNR family transcriptional regulator [Psychrobacillus insolitus]|uniref:CRP/FNR family transcriptional regulator n=1 Tax=Psychrobacillus insolitus TaxID=1461 RepID=A0A2W7MMV0_9BACI|nr:Crp/Fnr family transcriptional regulator [Psychrobacillus insolitus]PZX08205.1 CRP/FNR family transcriptional regulator [Psychrobacillus insolitus]